MSNATDRNMKTLADLLDENDVVNQKRPKEELLLDCLVALLKQFPDYTPPRLRADGDIIIPLDAALKKNRERSRNVATAISQMMNSDGQPKRSRAWVE